MYMVIDIAVEIVSSKKKQQAATKWQTEWGFEHVSSFAKLMPQVNRGRWEWKAVNVKGLKTQKLKGLNLFLVLWWNPEKSGGEHITDWVPVL